MSEAKEFANAVADQLIGVDGEESPIMAALREQVLAQVEPKIEDIAGDLSTMREGLAKGPPEAEKRNRIGAPPWNAQAPWNAMAASMGVPDANWYNPEAIGAEVDGKFADFGDFLKAMIRRDMRGVADDRLVNVKDSGAKAALTGEEIDLGGALVPEEFRPRLLNMMLQGISIRSLATVLPMGAPAMSLPAIRDSDHSGGNVFGGVAFNWLEVNDEITESRNLTSS